MNDTERIEKLKEAIMKAYDIEEKLYYKQYEGQIDETQEVLSGGNKPFGLTRAVLKHRTNRWILMTYLSSDFDEIFDIAIENLKSDKKIKGFDETKLIHKLAKI